MPRKEQRDMSHSTVWSKEFIPFGDRLDFLSPERQHLQQGKMKILPPRNPERRTRGDA